MRAAVFRAIVLAIPACILAWQVAEAQAGEEFRSVVSVRVTHQPQDATIPWQKANENTVLGNALVLATGQLLTTADLVKSATLIQVRKLGRYPDFQAELFLVDYDLDLALLTVADTEFWAGLVPIKFSAAPITFGRFVINRWRANGRFEQGTGEVVDLRTSSSRFGSMEIPIMRGNTNMTGLGWAEVMTVNGELVGLLTSHNRAEIQATPSPTLALFIQTANKLPYQGFAHRGFSWQRLNAPALREFHGLALDAPGILVNKVFAGGTGAGILQEGDILVQLGDYVIDPEGLISHPLYGSVLFPIAINDTIDPVITARIIRDGKPMELVMRRQRLADEDYRIRPHTFDRQIDYEVFGGLLLQELSLGYLKAWGKNWAERAPSRLVIEYALRSIRKADRPIEHLVIVSKVLPDVTNLGFEGIGNSILTHANGKPVTSLAAFREAISESVRGYHVLKVQSGRGQRKLVFKADEIAGANRRISQLYDVPPPPDP